MRRHDEANRGAMMGKERIRHNGNFFGGWFIMLFLVGMGLVLDPFGVFQDPIRDGSSRFWWLAIVGLVAGSAAAYTFFSKPYVQVEAGTLIVQNPLKKWRLPLGEVTFDPEGFPYTRAQVRGIRSG